MLRRALDDLSSLKSEALSALACSDPCRASIALDIAVNTLVRLRKYLPLGKNYRELLGAHGDLFELAAKFALNEGNIPKALIVLEAMRSTISAEHLRINIARSGKPKAISDDLLLLDRIRHQIWQQEVDLNTNSVGSSRLFQEHDELLAKLFKQDSNLANDLIENCQLKGLGDTCVNILIYGVFNSFTFVVLKQPNKTDCEYRILEFGTVKLRSLIEEYRAQLFQMNEHSLANDETLTRISRALTSDILNLIDDSFPLCIIPHGPLHELPFSAILHNGAWLGGQVELFNVPSISMLHRRYCHTKLSGKYVVALAYPGAPGVEDYLDGAIAELGVISTAFPEATCCIGPDATPERLFSLAPQADILHIACHAHLNAESPILSCLSLAPQNESTGEVTVAQFHTLALRASLVVINGCQTARGMHTVWDETVSLAQACLMAGGEAVIGGLWYLCDESTLEIMTQFYENVQAGETFSLALFNSRKKLIQLGRPPYEWSPFVLMGHGTGNWRMGSATRLRMTAR